MYLYDLDSYQKERGLNIPMTEITLQKCYTIAELYDIIDAGNVDNNNEQFIKKYLNELDGNSTKRIFNHLKEIMESEK
jgi:CDP-glycerol glycerophosphotransferase (TagB/SpsB family)